MSYREQTIALAGMFQAGLMVQEIAREGDVKDQEAFKTSINSILLTDVQTTEDVYGGLSAIRVGLKLLSTLYSPETKPRDMEITQYVLGIAHLEHKLAKDKAMLTTMINGIERAKSQADIYSPTHENVISNLASIYVETISNLHPRIVVGGEQGYLMQPHNAERVRSLLLALMRSAVLWRQKGGRRWQFLFSRSKIIKTATALLNEM